MADRAPYKPEPRLESFKRSHRRAASAPSQVDIKELWRQNHRFFLAAWLDWLTVLLITAAAGGLYFVPHVFTRYFPLTSPDGTIYYPDLSYPLVTPIFSSILAAIVCTAIPVVVILASQLWVQSAMTFQSALLGLHYALVTGTFFQIILKKTIGGFRPHFLTVCKPVLPEQDLGSGAGYQNVMWTVKEVCTGKKSDIEWATESFPSGHSETAFAGLGFLAIYLFAHLRIRHIRRRRAGHWRMLFVIIPLLLATYISCTLVLNYQHHWYDVLFGALIGVLMAVFGYRIVFCGVWDPRWNTVPILSSTEDHEERKRSVESPDQSEMQERTSSAGRGTNLGSVDGQHDVASIV